MRDSEPETATTVVTSFGGGRRKGLSQRKPVTSRNRSSSGSKQQGNGDLSFTITRNSILPKACTSLKTGLP